MRRADFSRWGIVALLFMVLIVLQQTFACLPPLFSEIQREVPMTKTEMGFVFAMVTVASIFLALVTGSVSDRFGSRWIVAGALLVAGLGAGMRFFVTSVAGLAVSTILVGVAVAGLNPNIPRVLAARFPPRELARVSGIVFSAMPIGVGLGLATSARVLSPTFGGWRGAMAFIGGLCVVAAVIWGLLYREPAAAAERRDHDALAGLSKVVRIGDLWLVGIYFGIFNFAVTPLMSLLPIVLEERGIAHSGEFVAIVMWVSVAGTLLTGAVSDKVGRRRPFLIAAALLSALCIPPLAALTGVPLVVALVITGTAQGMALPIVMTMPVEITGVGPSLAASAVGLTFMVGTLIGIAGPVVSGMVLDASGSPLAAFLLIAALLLAAAGVAVLLRETGSGSASQH